MFKILVLLIVSVTLSAGFPTEGTKALSKKRAAIVPSDADDLKTSETFHSGYNSGYPSLGFNAGPQGGGYGWRGDYKPFAGPVYGSPYEVGYAAVPVGSYGPYGPGALVSGGPIINGGGGYGWRQGVNRWSL